ncbi:hypothetical protein CCH79_00019509 [Gambusia affinis]|uniref:Calponin-homology (CH) domain-containing protein n=1 Tax=Gambusia affinis TaxID=33528 RepID=A0A315VIP5_GAMAF|nr:hypothetical protein CCH79_00019509 [Gambusia affinis]
MNLLCSSLAPLSLHTVLPSLPVITSHFVVVAPPSLPCSPPPSCLDPSLLSQASPLHRRHGDGGMLSPVFLRSHKSMESVDPQFTMRRKMEQLREELELMEQLRDIIESRLKVVLPEDLGSSLMDGVVLCHLANHIRPRSVASIHVPSPAVVRVTNAGAFKSAGRRAERLLTRIPKLSMAKCRRNVENFLDACRKIGVPQSSLCSPYDITQCRLHQVRTTILALVALDTTPPDRKHDKTIPARSPAPCRASETRSLVSVTTQTPPPAWQIWDDKLCLPHHILEEKGLVKVCVTVQALVDEASSKPPVLV